MLCGPNHLYVLLRHDWPRLVCLVSLNLEQDKIVVNLFQCKSANDWQSAKVRSSMIFFTFGKGVVRKQKCPQWHGMGWPEFAAIFSPHSCLLKSKHSGGERWAASFLLPQNLCICTADGDIFSIRRLVLSCSSLRAGLTRTQNILPLRRFCHVELEKERAWVYSIFQMIFVVRAMLLCIGHHHVLLMYVVMVRIFTSSSLM